MKNVVEKNIGPLKTLTVDGKLGGPCVVLFHGYGADASDLVPLADMMNLSKDITWVFPNAHQEVIVAAGFSGRAWFQVDSRRLEQSIMAGQPLDMSKTTPQGIETARKMATALYEELLTRHSKVILGGFSQGAMLATEMTLTAQRKPAGLVIMSGTLICEDRWKTLVKNSKDVPFFQSHGKNDAILGYDYAERLFEVLSDGGMHGDFMSFSGGHEIPLKVIERIGKFLR